MFATKLAAAAGIAALGLAASAGIAQAATAYATGNVNVRSGPGTGYGVIDVLRTGDRVDVQQCRGSWCFVEKPGPDGWFSASFLDSGGYRPPPVVVRPPPVIVRPPVYHPPVYRPPYYPPRPPQHWPPRHRPPHGGPGQHYPGYGGNGSANFCYNGPNGYFCLGN